VLAGISKKYPAVMAVQNYSFTENSIQFFSLEQLNSTTPKVVATFKRATPIDPIWSRKKMNFIEIKGAAVGSNFASITFYPRYQMLIQSGSSEEIHSIGIEDLMISHNTIQIKEINTSLNLPSNRERLISPLPNMDFGELIATANLFQYYTLQDSVVSFFDKQNKLLAKAVWSSKKSD
jgi:hypothetical protein